ncbi:MAG: D-alanyl-D-alanine carboxypeptidase/D-alanyl-D-alanine-endopeptidase [Nitrospinae bacterium]|nr:D-alanyl-D-alanine carboxypeptidase/D-alanyl-D-alanine-endopeptidase [Nitrospinota bacterium]
MNRKIAIGAAVFAMSFGVAFADTYDELSGLINGALKERCVNHDKTAVRVVDIETGQVVYDRNGGTPLTPASVMKLVTTAAALNYLGVDYRFKTDVLYSGKREGGVLKGDIIVHGGGDPKLTPENIWRIAEEIRRQGITEVSGSLVADDTFFDGFHAPKGRGSKKTQRPYDAPHGALSVNFNTIGLHVYPGERDGEPIVAEVEPKSDYIRIVNEAVTRSKSRRPIGAFRVNGSDDVVVKVTGAMRPGDAGGVIYMAIEDPLQFAAETFAAYFKRAGIKIAGGIKKEAAPQNARILYTHQSEPLPVILRELNRHSNNFIAEQTLKTMAAEAGGSPGSAERGLALANQMLMDMGVDTSGLVFSDGSGLSKDNKLTAKALTELLAAMSKRFDIGPDFMASLGIMGVDGTVRKRLKTSPAKAQARAKTGTLNGASALSGYVAGKDNKLYAFAILQNNGCFNYGSHNIEDKIITAIYLTAEKKH